MWKKGELVWVRLNPSDSWIPGRILDPSEPLGVLVSFFDLMEPRYVPKPCLRSFDRDFETLVADSLRFRRFVNRALQTHFWNISFGLWCSCQPPIDSPYLERGYSLPCSPPLSSDSALSFVREMAVSRGVPLRRLAETNGSTAQILSFRRYSVGLNRSESVYEEVIESAKLMDGVEEPDWYLDPSNNMDCIYDMVSMFPETEDADVDNSSDPLPKDIHCCSVDKLVQSWNTRSTVILSDSSVMKACGTMARISNEEEAAQSLKSRERCQVEQSICLLNSESRVEDIIEEDTTTLAAQREAPPEVMIETHDDDITGSDDRAMTSAKQLSPLLDASNSKAFLAKPVSFVVLEACKNLACSVEETSANPRSKLDGSVMSANTLDEDQSDRNHSNGTRDNCHAGQVSLHITGSSNKEFGSDDVGIAPVEQLHDLEVATTVENQISAADNIRSTGAKRKASRDKASGNSKRRKKGSQQSIAADKPQNLQVLKDERFADPKCLRMKFMSTHVNLPSKSELLKRFSVFGKIDASRTDVNPGGRSAKVVFLQSIDAVTAYQFARSKKFKLGRSKVVYRLDASEGDIEVNKAPLSQKPQQSVPSPRSCLKKHDSVDKEEGRSHLKVTFETTNT
ncbi:hypothetical protein HID58_020947 [Brassica napus]|uniref:(rape) hypothetical protein n=1 Tax=Brassica napus TaxID=3708 RepID=A0A816S6F1_BRANA|nr:uncharacterized protein LOC106406291 [Brassica napus]KAH0920929.1 hypothetical protein HID58_020947 [Brassica napus]CAF2081791.1 unnamed protein product [Brassica napus]